MLTFHDSLLAAPSEEKYENPETRWRLYWLVSSHCEYSRAQSKAVFTGIQRKVYCNPSWGKSRESQNPTWILCSLSLEEYSYSQVLRRISWKYLASRGSLYSLSSLHCQFLLNSRTKKEFVFTRISSKLTLVTLLSKITRELGRTGRIISRLCAY
jgi:hypothetical protein